jgi:hypothetical protein
MTGSSPKSRQKRLNRSILKMPRWTKIARDRGQNACGDLKNAVPADTKAVTLENSGEVRQSPLKIKLLGKYRLI